MFLIVQFCLIILSTNMTELTAFKEWARKIKAAQIVELTLRQNGSQQKAVNSTACCSTEKNMMLTFQLSSENCFGIGSVQRFSRPCFCVPTIYTQVNIRKKCIFVPMCTHQGAGANFSVSKNKIKNMPSMQVFEIKLFSFLYQDFGICFFYFTEILFFARPPIFLGKTLFGSSTDIYKH